MLRLDTNWQKQQNSKLRMTLYLNSPCYEGEKGTRSGQLEMLSWPSFSIAWWSHIVCYSSYYLIGFWHLVLSLAWENFWCPFINVTCKPTHIDMCILLSLRREIIWSYLENVFMCVSVGREAFIKQYEYFM